FNTRTVDAGYPVDIAPFWPGLPPVIRAGVEWSQAGPAALTQEFTSACQGISTSLLAGDVGQIFTVDARFSGGPYPVLCGCAQYRQFVRGIHTLDGVPNPAMLPDPNGGPSRPMLPIPPSGEGNFLEDANVGTVKFYGHRALPPDKFARYTPDQ